MQIELRKSAVNDLKSLPKTLVSVHPPPLFPGSAAILASISAGETPTLPGGGERLQTLKDVVHSKIAELVNFPNVSNIKKLTNFEPAYRLRIGDYRVLFDIKNDNIVIGRVLHRKESYKK